MSERPKKMWEILSAIPIIELQTASPEELAKVREGTKRQAQQRRQYEKMINKPISEVLDFPKQ